MTLVGVDATLHADDRFAREITEQQSTAVTLHWASTATTERINTTTPGQINVHVSAPVCGRAADRRHLLRTKSNVGCRQPSLTVMRKENANHRLSFSTKVT